MIADAIFRQQPTILLQLNVLLVHAKAHGFPLIIKIAAADRVEHRHIYLLTAFGHQLAQPGYI